MSNFKSKIPNIITSCNLISGCIAVVFALRGAAPTALLFIAIGAVFDFLDGFSARLLNVSTKIGLELDSLADDVTFGVAPSAILFAWFSTCPYPEFLEPYRWIVPYLAFIMAAFSASRLAHFNLDTRQTTSFIGLPTPANALFWSSLVVGCPEILSYSPWMTVLLLLMMFTSCWLLVSEIPMFALKFKHWHWAGNRLRYVFLVSCLPILAVFWITGIAIIIGWYVILSVLTVRMNAKVNLKSN